MRVVGEEKGVGGWRDWVGERCEGRGREGKGGGGNWVGVGMMREEKGGEGG